MEPLLDLRRCWRAVRASTKARGEGPPTWSHWEDDPASLAKLGLHRIDALAEHECLFLLGRPGAGKTSEIQRLQSGRAGEFSDEYLVVMSCKDITGSVDAAVERDRGWRVASTQTKPVRLVLDALDEGFLRDGGYFSSLKQSLENLRYDHPRLRLTLVCRPAEWDAGFGHSIHTAWSGGGAPNVYTLEQLSWRSRREFVENLGVKSVEDLFAWVRRNNFEEFAAWPRSLKWLAEQFREGGAEKITYTEVCRRRVSRSFGEDKRLVEGRRADRSQHWTHALTLIAATLVFCGRKGIALDGDEPGYLTLDEMFAGKGPLAIPGKPVLDRESAREAVVNSHLMENQGKYHRFQNQSDLEYLAADLLTSLEEEQLTELFGCEDETGRWRVFPPLCTTAANLAAQSPDFCEWLREHDPRVLLRVDFASKSAEVRRAAVDAIFKATAEADATGGHDRQAHLGTLRHPGIEEQLRPWLHGPKDSSEARHLAFDVAFACCGPSFWEEFERTAATSGDPFLEARRPSVIARFGREWPESKLREIAALAEGNLAGAAMMALLDRGWKPGALAGFLRESTGNTYETYDMLIGRRILRECAADDVPPLLGRITPWLSMAHSGGTLADLGETLLTKGFPAFDRSEVRESLVKFITTRIGKHTGLFRDHDPKYLVRLGLGEATRRRAVLLALAEACPVDPPVDFSALDGLLLPEDYPWLLEQVTEARGSSALVFARLAGGIAWQLGDEHGELLDRAYAASDEIRRQLPTADAAGIFATLRGLRAEAQEKQRLRLEEFHSKLEKPRYDHTEHLTDALAACRAGDFLRWTTSATRWRNPPPPAMTPTSYGARMSGNYPAGRPRPTNCAPS